MNTNNLVENFGKKKYARKRLGLIKWRE
jgi:hypothetical protein